MAPKIPSEIQCLSTAMLERELGEVRAGLDLVESEDSWDKIHRAIQRLNAITVGSAENYASQIIAACKSVAQSIANSLNSERSRLSGAATDLLATLATQLHRQFETLIPLFVPALLTLASRSNKIFIARAKVCLTSIVEYCGSPVIIPLLRHSISDKSVSLRLTAIDLIVACLNTFNPPDLETPGRVEDIEAIIRATGRDANADVRESSRKAFEAYTILFPSRVDAFVALLTPKMKKYLGVSNIAAKKRMPLHLLAAAETPSAPSSSQRPEHLPHSQPPARVPAKRTAATVPATKAPATRVEKPRSFTSKPPSASAAPASDSALMPPPPPPETKKSSSGPVRPPLAVQQALAAASTIPMRPKLARHASRPNVQTSGTMADIAKSLPSSRVGAQRPEKIPIPPSTSATGVAQTASELSKGHATAGPRRAARPEPASNPNAGSSAPSAPSRKPVDILMKTVRKKAILTSSASVPSSSSAHKDVYACPCPPSGLASSSTSKSSDEAICEREITERDKREQLERMARKRTESQTEQSFHRVSRVGTRSRKLLASKDQELHSQSTRTRMPPPVTEVELNMCHELRTDKAPERSETHAEVAAPEKIRKKRVERPPFETDSRPVVAVGQRLLAEEERRRRRTERAAEATDINVLVRAPSKRSEEDTGGPEKPPKRRREDLADDERGQRERRHRVKEVQPARDVASADGPTVGGGTAATKDAPPCKREKQQAEEPNDASNSRQLEEVEGSKQVPRKTEYRSIGGDNELTPSEEVNAHSEPRTPPREDEVRPEQQFELCGIRPLAIHKASGSDAELERPPTSEIPPAPPHHPSVFETPAPIRNAMALRKKRVPSTPISKLIASIQRGFETDCNTIEEEPEDGTSLFPGVEAVTMSSAPEEGLVFKEQEQEGRDDRGLDHRGDNAEASDENLFFVDGHLRKQKSDRSKVHGDSGRVVHDEITEARVPFNSRLEN